jgi:hypothetical protein
VTEPDDAPLWDPTEALQGRRVVCRECRRPLTGPAAARGVGDDCWWQTGHGGDARRRRFDVPQDGIPGL